MFEYLRKNNNFQGLFSSVAPRVRLSASTSVSAVGRADPVESEMEEEEVVATLASDVVPGKGSMSVLANVCPRYGH